MGGARRGKAVIRLIYMPPIFSDEIINFIYWLFEYAREHCIELIERLYDTSTSMLKLRHYDYVLAIAVHKIDVDLYSVTLFLRYGTNISFTFTGKKMYSVLKEMLGECAVLSDILQAAKELREAWERVRRRYEPGAN